ncbi:nucleotidyl transferase AbiEii/AbiGii toxin family protein [Massilia solisilvae]|uniref:Nucleotidyl transferase AbiEii/AbiGii toxin family protein n=1 Tax=Massilia solisilvae TaxID=1811225 RepID=A0ABT2BDW6_9BURK|nr:nucleotidyl transferase AbiEii/AbiGii toxin family protein [Massilia solisilvae]MCS0606713.1 nucleotidyl transferase AbiEii/AbiGii toxin family protein [Massilia solisilvae]
MADERTWEGLFQDALRLVDEIRTHGSKHLYWTFGGGTVLMRKYRHRLSKDIDIFVPDPQVLNYVNPRLSQVAEDLTVHYDEANSFIKLFLPDGEIDFVASSNLTENPYVDEEIFGRTVHVEAAAEIVAKKLFHRGDHLLARDMFDFALVAEKEPDELLKASRFLVRHITPIKATLAGDLTNLRLQFDAIEKLSFNPTFDRVRDIVIQTLDSAAQHVEKETYANRSPTG